MRMLKSSLKLLFSFNNRSQCYVLYNRTLNSVSVQLQDLNKFLGGKWSEVQMRVGIAMFFDVLLFNFLYYVSIPVYFCICNLITIFFCSWKNENCSWNVNKEEFFIRRVGLGIWRRVVFEEGRQKDGFAEHWFTLWLYRVPNLKKTIKNEWRFYSNRLLK